MAMELPCETCKFKTVRTQGHRVFIGCQDPEKKKANFHKDMLKYHHTCDAWVNNSALEKRGLLLKRY